MRLGVDAGNHTVKIFGDHGPFSCSSILGEYRERSLDSSFGEDDVIYEFKGRKGFAGKLAEIESNYSGSMIGSTKAHEDTLIRVLIGLSRYKRRSDSYQIVVGQPIEMHREEEKMRIKKLLLGDHGIVVNGNRHNLLIDRVEVAAEGGVAFWSMGNPRAGRIRILDFGSGTVNGATLLDGKYVDRDSFTVSFGTSTLEAEDTDAFMRAVYIRTQQKRWRKTDTVLLAGWSADKMLPMVQQYYQNAEVLRPKDPTSDGMKLLHPVYANAVAMYKIAQEVFQ